MADVPRCELCGGVIRLGVNGGACRRCDGVVVREELLRPLKREGWIGGYVLGIRFALRGAWLTLTTPKLLALTILPFLVSLGVFAATAWYTWGYVQDIDFVDDIPVLGHLAIGIRVLLAGVVAALATLLVSAVIAAPFLEWMSEAVESILFGHGDETPLTPHYVWHYWIVPVLQALVLVL